MSPKVSFIVPCYKLAHFLSDCVGSILSQSYGDFEILIMDDCSPDDTPEVARSFRDARVKHIRNEANLGHLRNYNKGIELSRGKYVWLISADDSLRKPYILERYVEVLENHPEVGYVFCPAVEFVEGRENGIAKWLYQEPEDKIFVHHEFFKLIIKRCLVAAPTGLVRRHCYELSKFPLDLPFAGDWYLWCLFALHYDVAYLADPMVYYRIHDSNMTVDFLDAKRNQRIADEISVRWQIKRAAERAGKRDVVRLCEEAITIDYIGRVISSEGYNSQFGLTIESFEQSLANHSHPQKETGRIRARIYSELGDRYYWQGKGSQAATFYRVALQEQFSTKPWLKSMLLKFGNSGNRLLRFLSTAKQLIRQ